MRCAVLGDPISHSLSPVLHRAGYAAHGLAWEYDAMRVASGGLGEFLAGLDASWRGLSLTMPLKREAMALADRVSETARAARAANTLVLVDGGVHADNTDVPGAAAAVRERFDGPIGTVTVLGGGATAASTGLALAGLGARSFRLLVRSPERAAETAAVIGAHPSGPRVEVGSLADDPVDRRRRRLDDPGGGPGRGADRPVRRRTGRVRGPLRPLADAAGGLGRGPGPRQPGSTCSCTRPRSSSVSSPAWWRPLAAMREAGETALAARQVGT